MKLGVSLERFLRLNIHWIWSEDEQLANFKDRDLMLGSKFDKIG